MLETGSAGIFGLCKKKARIRVTRKKSDDDKAEVAETSAVKAEPVQQPAVTVRAEKEKKEETAAVPESKSETGVGEGVDARADESSAGKTASRSGAAAGSSAKPGKSKKQASSHSKKPVKSAGQPEKKATPAAPVERVLPSDEVLASIKEDIVGLLEVMGFPSEVTVELVDYSIACRIDAEHQESLVGNEGRTLDSLQYLLRKMMARRLPDRMMLSLDVGDYRDRRIEELREQAATLAAQVKEDGKTQAIPALNPSERRVVHMILQEDKAIRSRSVGEGLFKKVLIYKPGKKKRPPSRKGTGKGRQGGRAPKKGD